VEALWREVDEGKVPHNNRHRSLDRQDLGHRGGLSTSEMSQF
jgi:hypothetical protein